GSAQGRREAGLHRAEGEARTNHRHRTGGRRTAEDAPRQPGRVEDAAPRVPRSRVGVREEAVERDRAIGQERAAANASGDSLRTNSRTTVGSFRAYDWSTRWPSQPASAAVQDSNRAVLLNVERLVRRRIHRGFI